VSLKTAFIKRKLGKTFEKMSSEQISPFKADSGLTVFYIQRIIIVNIYCEKKFMGISKKDPETPRKWCRIEMKAALLGSAYAGELHVL